MSLAQEILEINDLQNFKAVKNCRKGLAMYLTSVSPKHLETGSYRVMILEIESEYKKSTLYLRVSYLLFDRVLAVCYPFDETIRHNCRMKHSVDFFDFLKSNEIEFGRFEDLQGLVFDANLERVASDGIEVLALTDRKLVAKP